MMEQSPLLDVPPTGLSYFEEQFSKEGIAAIAGVDEAGRGCLAGPVVAAGVILPSGLKIAGLNDSKQLSENKREFYYKIICRESLAWAIGIVSPKEIDQINILKASLEAMRQAVTALKVKPDILLIDGPHSIESKIMQKTLNKGDCRSISIAAASVMAKVTRDRIMVEYERQYPSFSFSVHKGYGTALHLRELETHGPTPIHRMTFAPVAVKYT